MAYSHDGTLAIVRKVLTINQLSRSAPKELGFSDGRPENGNRAEGAAADRVGSALASAGPDQEGVVCSSANTATSIAGAEEIRPRRWPWPQGKTNHFSSPRKSGVGDHHPPGEPNGVRRSAGHGRLGDE